MAYPPEAFPLISVIMPVYNRQHLVSEAIESILAQTWKKFELIIADDGSTDDTPDIITSYARQDSRIRPCFFPHRGIPATSNAAVALSNGTIIARQDSDDIALPERLHRQYHWMQAEELDICGCQTEVFGEKEYLSGIKPGINRLPESHEIICRMMLFCTAVWNGAMMIKKHVCTENPYNEKLMFIDCEWPLQTAMKYKLGNVPEVLLRVRRHKENATAVETDDFYKAEAKCRFTYLYYLFPGTPLPDYMVYRRLADIEPMSSLCELERAGKWLIEIGAYSDTEFRERLCRRWQKVCQLSSDLPPERETVFHRYLNLLQRPVPETEKD